MKERILAKIVATDFEIEDHGIPIWSVQFDYDDGSSQGLGGYTAEISFMCRLLRSVGVNSFNRLKGKSCFVTHDNSHIYSIEPLHKKDGIPFIIQDWRNWVEKRGARLTPYELVTGKQP